MIRKITIAKKWQGNKPVSAINLSGIWLQENNFNIGERVRVEVFRDEIRIKKATAKDILEDLKIQNPNLESLIMQLDCELCEL